MYHWVEDKDFLNRAHSKCADLVNQLVQEAKKHGVGSSMKTVGSMGRNMVTQNEKEPIDFDFNLWVQNVDFFGSGKELKESVRKAFDVVLKRNGLDNCEDSRSALTTKKMHFPQGNRTEFSIDVCIVKKDAYGLHRLIHKKTGVVQNDQWFWNLIPDSKDLHEKEKALKESEKWNVVREAYLDKKNMYLRRGDHEHPSFICYIESVNDIYNQVCPPERRYWNEISAIKEFY